MLTSMLCLHVPGGSELGYEELLKAAFTTEMIFFTGIFTICFIKLSVIMYHGF